MGFQFHFYLRSYNKRLYQISKIFYTSIKSTHLNLHCSIILIKVKKGQPFIRVCLTIAFSLHSSVTYTLPALLISIQYKNEISWVIGSLLHHTTISLWVFYINNSRTLLLNTKKIWIDVAITYQHFLIAWLMMLGCRN